jgi:hypothetical protein
MARKHESDVEINLDDQWELVGMVVHMYYGSI